MPTIVVESNALTDPLQRRVAKRVSWWLHKEGIPIAHVIVKFRPLASVQVFSGPHSFDAVVGDHGAFAFANCYIAQDRPTAFRRDLARVLIDALSPDIDPHYVYVFFHGVGPDDYLLGKELVASSGVSR